MEKQEITHIHLNGRYTVTYERSATKGVDGFKVTANGDDLETVEKDAADLKMVAGEATKPLPATEVKA